MEDVKVDFRNAGKCAFARKETEKGQVIGVYDGEYISRSEARKRELVYSTEGKVSAMFHLENDKLV